MNNVYGYVNGKAVYSRDEFIFTARGFGAIETDEELLAYAEKVTSNWYNAGWHRTFATYYLGNYALDHPYCDLTTAEYNRLKELQKQVQDELKRADEAKEWKLVDTTYWADNSIEETYESKDGERKVVMVVGPHGDAC